MGATLRRGERTGVGCLGQGLLVLAASCMLVGIGSAPCGADVDDVGVTLSDTMRKLRPAIDAGDVPRVGKSILDEAGVSGEAKDREELATRMSRALAGKPWEFGAYLQGIGVSVGERLQLRAGAEFFLIEGVRENARVFVRGIRSLDRAHFLSHEARCFVTPDGMRTVPEMIYRLMGQALSGVTIQVARQDAFGERLPTDDAAFAEMYDLLSWIGDEPAVELGEAPDGGVGGERRAVAKVRVLRVHRDVRLEVRAAWRDGRWWMERVVKQESAGRAPVVSVDARMSAVATSRRARD